MANDNAAAQNAYIHAINAAKATQQQSNASAANTQQLAINLAQQTQLLGDSAAEAAYQIQLNSFAKTQALSGAAANMALSLAINGALATQSTADAAAGSTYAHAMNGLTKQYSLDMGDANAASVKAGNDASTQYEVATDNAAATAWTDWASSSGGDPYATYEAETQAAWYTYHVVVRTLYGAAMNTHVDAENQWAHDVSEGWLTYQNDLADHATTAVGAMTAAATALTNAIATNANTFATTVAPAIQSAADAEVNNGFTAIQSGASAAQTYASDTAADALAATEAQILAVQTLSDACGDDAEQQAISDSAAGVVLAEEEAEIIEDIAEPAPAVGASKDEFEAKLKALVEKAGLSHGEGDKRLYIPEETNGQYDCDCEDIADIMQRFLHNNFNQATGETISMIIVRWTEPEIGSSSGVVVERVHGHAMLVVEHGGKFWRVDPTRGDVAGPYATIEALKAELGAYVESEYDATAGSVYVAGTYSSLGAMTYGIDSPLRPWYRDPTMRWHVADYFYRNHLDPRDYFPRGMTPPTTPPNEGPFFYGTPFSGL